MLPFPLICHPPLSCSQLLDIKKIMFLRCLFCCSAISVPESLPYSINYVIILSLSFLISSFFFFFLRDAIAVAFWSQHLHMGILTFVCLSKTSNLPERKGTWMIHFQRYCLVYSFCLYIYIYIYTPWLTIKFRRQNLSSESCDI